MRENRQLGVRLAHVDPVLLDGDPGGEDGKIKIQAGEGRQGQGNTQGLQDLHGRSIRQPLASYKWKLDAPSTSSSITGLDSDPMPSISTVTVSPGWRKRGGFRAGPSPWGVHGRVVVCGRSVVSTLRTSLSA